MADVSCHRDVAALRLFLEALSFFLVEPNLDLNIAVTHTGFSFSGLGVSGGLPLTSGLCGSTKAMLAGIKHIVLPWGEHGVHSEMNLSMKKAACIATSCFTHCIIQFIVIICT